jgi:hypothetical protein
MRGVVRPKVTHHSHEHSFRMCLREGETPAEPSPPVDPSSGMNMVVRVPIEPSSGTNMVVRSRLSRSFALPTGPPGKSNSAGFITGAAHFGAAWGIDE